MNGCNKKNKQKKINKNRNFLKKHNLFWQKK